MTATPAASPPAEGRAGGKTAVVLFNLGGPDSLEAVQPFLRNLFSDPAILTVRQPLRWFLARLIAGRRAAPARAIYEELGGASPLLANTEAQARALEALLAPEGMRVFIAMRYWHPRAAEAAAAVKAWGADRVVLLPLYPQFSTTSTGSSLTEWRSAAARAGLAAPTVSVCCFPDLGGFIESMAQATAVAIRDAATAAPARVLLSAHGLPERVIRRGDPYAWQVERTAATIMARVAVLAPDLAGVEWRVSYQSRATPEKWLQPDTVEEVKQAGTEGRSLVMVPIAFVSEHSETLVELDREYRDLAASVGVARYERVRTVGTAAAFIASLAQLARAALRQPGPLCSSAGGRLCPTEHAGCPFRERAAAE